MGLWGIAPDILGSISKESIAQIKCPCKEYLLISFTNEHIYVTNQCMFFTTNFILIKLYIIYIILFNYI